MSQCVVLRSSILLIMVTTNSIYLIILHSRSSFSFLLMWQHPLMKPYFVYYLHCRSGMKSWVCLSNSWAVYTFYILPSTNNYPSTNLTSFYFIYANYPNKTYSESQTTHQYTETIRSQRSIEELMPNPFYFLFPRHSFIQKVYFEQLLCTINLWGNKVSFSHLFTTGKQRIMLVLTPVL